MKPLAPNTLLQNRYLIVHLIGKGGMGEVYLAVDQRLGSAVALKRTFFSDDLTLGNAFEREARTLARLRHPVLPKVSDHFVENEMQYLVMDHISGEDLSERLRTNKKPFPLSWVLFWADQLLDALAYLHSHEPPIVHRDIKPQNLKLTDENHIILLDFGLAKNSVSETRVTTSGSVVGYTPHYAPMEQIRGTGTDARSDIYSLSATLYQILTNTVPPDSLTRADAIISGLSDPIKQMYEVNPEVPRTVSDVILRGMSVSQDQRFSSAREMQKELRDAYARMQTATAEKTIAFSAEQSAQIQSANQNSSLENTSPVYHTNSKPDFQSHPFGQNFDSTSSSRNDKTFAPPSVSQNLAEKPLSNNANGEAAPKQADIKTEVIPAGSIPEIVSLQEPISQPPDLSFGEDFNAESEVRKTRDFSTQINAPSAENFSPESSVPLISFANAANEADFSQNQTAANIVSVPSEPREDYSAPSYTAEENFNQTPESFDSRPATHSAPKQKSNGKIFAVIGGLAALVLLTLGGAVGLYLFSKSNEKTTDITVPTQSATPEATVYATPTVEPTVESAGTNSNESNTNESALTNSNASPNESANSAVSQNSNIASPVQAGQPTPPRAATPKPTPQVVTAKTPKPTPKPTPKNGRPDVLEQ